MGQIGVVMVVDKVVDVVVIVVDEVVDVELGLDVLFALLFESFFSLNENDACSPVGLDTVVKFDVPATGAELYEEDAQSGGDNNLGDSGGDSSVE